MLPRRVRLTVERLEDRRTPATATFGGGVLQVRGTAAAETLRVEQVGDRIVFDGRSISASVVRSVVVRGDGGNDVIDLRTLRVGATVFGGAGNDTILGTPRNDRLFGDAGTDRLAGDAGDDFLDDGNRAAQEYADGGAGQDWNADVTAVAGTAATDIFQGDAPACSFLAAAAGLAQQGTDFRRWISYAGATAAGVPHYRVALWGGGRWNWVPVAFDGSRTGLDPTPAAEGESWVVLMQRAWLRFHGGDGTAWPHEAFLALTGRPAAYRYGVADGDFGRIASALRGGRAVAAATPYAGGSTALLVDGHAYTVLGATGSGASAQVLVRNPWGYDGAAARGDTADGLIWLRWADFRASMNYLAIG